MKSVWGHENDNTDVYRWLAGNSRLWSVQGPVSRHDFGQSKAYTMKQ